MLARRVCRSTHAPSVYHATYAQLQETLRGVLRGGVKPAGSETAAIQYWACAALFELLNAHPVDQRGRCRSCRRRGLGETRCLVYANASYWLHYSRPRPGPEA
ncbi:MAG: hypothetical protein ACRDQX_00845 [Pseudonocardiaceae bacterium]